MRVDSPKGVKAWLIGKFSGSFKGYLEGTAASASLAETASYSLFAESASYADYAEAASSSIFSDSSSFAGQAESASWAETATSASWTLQADQAATASYIKVEDIEGIEEKLSNEYLPITGGVLTGSLEITKDLLLRGKLSLKEGLHTEGDIVVSGSMNKTSPTGSTLRFFDTWYKKGACISYSGAEDAIRFLFTSTMNVEDEKENLPEKPGTDTGSGESSGSGDTSITIPNTSH